MSYSRNRVANGHANRHRAAVAPATPSPLAAIGLAISAMLLANANPATGQTPPAPVTRVEPIVVTGNPLGDTEVILPVRALTGVELLLRKGLTLGDTLNALPGVSMTWFGPNANRPVVRGLDGDRIRVLGNGGAALDASALSFDHSVPIDPLVVERVEVLRGPGALLYGGNAVGGVVNVIDNRIPKAPLDQTAGALEARFGGTERERGASALMEGGNGGFAVHADGFRRETRDYAVPSSAGVGTRVVNSSANSNGGAIGASFTTANGYLGAGTSEYRSNYGTVAEAEVRIDMKQRKNAVEAEWQQSSGWLAAVRAKAADTQYSHTEYDAGVAGTIFKNDGSDARLELEHHAISGWRGVVGGQWEDFTFSALGDEAFLPVTRTRNQAVFIVEEYKAPKFKLSLGARAETSEVDSDGAGGASIERFGARQSRRFNLTSLAAGGLVDVGSGLKLAASLSSTERAPTYYELFADGPHIATAAYEVGDARLKRERARSFDLGLRWRQGPHSASLSVFATRFDGFINLRRSGADRDAAGNADVIDCGDGTSEQSGCEAEILPEFRYQSVSARFTGFELETKFRVLEGNGTLDLEVTADRTRATDQTNREPIARIAPARFNTALAWNQGRFSARLEAARAAKQDRVPASDTRGATPAHTLVNAALTWRFESGKAGGLLFVKGTNLGNQRAFNAATIDTIRALAPLPGRGIRVGMQITF